MPKVISIKDYLEKEPEIDTVEGLLEVYNDLGPSDRREMLKLFFERFLENRKILKGYSDEYKRLRDKRLVRERRREMAAIFNGLVEKAKTEYIPLEKALAVLEQAGFDIDLLQDCKTLKDVVDTLWDDWGSRRH
jgi:hypothetical protein